MHGHHKLSKCQKQVLYRIFEMRMALRRDSKVKDYRLEQNVASFLSHDLVPICAWGQ